MEQSPHLTERLYERTTYDRAPNYRAANDRTPLRLNSLQADTLIVKRLYKCEPLTRYKAFDLQKKHFFKQKA